MYFRYFFFLLLRLPPTSTLFPYTTLFRSHSGQREGYRGSDLYPAGKAYSGSNIHDNPSFGNCCGTGYNRSEEHTSELQSLTNLVCRLLLEKKKKKNTTN